MSTSPQHTPIAQPTEPLDIDGVRATTVGTAVWATAFLVLLLTGVRFGDSNGWWLWVCIAGFGIGLIAIAFTRRRAAVYAAHARSISEPADG